jgi:hypothetical protein
MRTAIAPTRPKAAITVVAIPNGRDRIHPPRPKAPNKRAIPTRKQKESGVCYARMDEGILPLLGKLAAIAAAKVIPKVTSKSAIEAMTASRAPGL